MVIDREGTDDELLGDLGVGESLRDQAQHFDLAGSQIIGIGHC